MTKKVFVLVHQSVCECGVDTHVWAFSTREQSENALHDLFATDINEIPKDVRVCLKNKDSYEIYEKDRFCTNNCTAYIYETEIDSPLHAYHGTSL